MQNDKLVLNKSEALKTVYGFCVQYDLEVTISKECLKIVLPCGAEVSATFDPVGCDYEAGRLIYKQFLAAKQLMREMKEKEQAITEESLYQDYLNNVV